MAAVPIYVWNGTAWQETGPVIPASPIKYQASAPTSPSTGDIWIDSDGDVTTGSQQFQRFRFVASGGETSISGVDANGATLAYTAGTEIVVLNGSTLVRGQDYTATNGTSITGLSPALVASDVLEVFSFMAFNVANTYTQSQVDGFITSLGGTSTAWTAYTPTWTNLTIGNATQDFKYKQIGKTVHVIGRMQFGSTTSMGSDPQMSLPITSVSYHSTVPLGVITLQDSGTNTFGGYARFSSTTSIIFAYLSVSGSYIAASSTPTSTLPFTWTTGDALTVNITYEAA